MKKQKQIRNMQRRRTGPTPIPRTKTSKARTSIGSPPSELMARTATLASSGSQTRYFIHGPTGLHSQQELDGAWRYPLLDGLSSVRGVTEDALSLLESRGYDPFGNLVDTQGISQTPFGFTGEITDPNDLVHLRARYYNPALGVFPDPDPMLEGFQDPISLNQYAYVNSNPVNLTDPSGLTPQSPEKICPPDWDMVLPSTDCANGDAGCLSTVWCRQGNRIVPGATAWDEYHSSYAGQAIYDEARFNLTGYRAKWWNPLDTAKHFAGSMLIPLASATAHTSYYGRVALGWEPQPSGMSRLEVSAETVFGLYDLYSWGSFSDVRYGVQDRDPVRVGFGAVGIISFTLTAAGAHSRLRSLGDAEPLNACGVPTVTADAIRGSQTGTVYDQITPVGPNWPGHQIPQSFYLNSGDETFYVIRAATKHMPEYFTGSGIISVSPLQDQMLLTSFEASVEYAVSTGMYTNFDTAFQVGDWEFVFRQGTGGPYDVIGHAVYNPGGGH